MGTVRLTEHKIIVFLKSVTAKGPLNMSVVGRLFPKSATKTRRRNMVG